MRWDPINKQYNSEMNMPWHKWFAWYPVVVNNKRVWIKTIFRKGTRHHRSGQWNWDYAFDEFDLLKKDVINPEIPPLPPPPPMPRILKF